jgi:imidazoleglycerol-phosphate dehydratase
MRNVEITRKTNETEINVKLGLDGSGQYRIHTGLGFLDHMLSHLALHGLFDLELMAEGDLEVDPHHTVEDCALALGQAFDRALGERKGIVRIASSYVPMDESLAFVSLDLSGRPYAVIEATWHTPAIGSVPTSLLPHFLESLAFAARMNLHGRVLYGRDDHHQAEALFKALGRALDAATQIDPRRQEAFPSTKGGLL